VAVYRADGSLAYGGGVTASRGHAGDNENLDAVAAVLDGREPVTRRGKVFGCSIFCDTTAAATTRDVNE
jgi:hypothetical protein